jgi:2-dehydro-3-deoxyphosphogluconate aldolase/(4S)-4-hydroxy-2-oxoglutarate aldolase
MMTIETTLQHLYQNRIPVIRAGSLDDALWISQQLLDAGFACLEFTLTTPNIATFFDHPRPPWMPESTLVGLGTLTTASQVERLLAMPHPPDFVASPGLLNAFTLRQAIAGFEARDVLYMAGVATPSELMHALALGVQAVKWFPAEPLGGASMLKTIKAPFPQAKLIPFGGMHPSKVNAYLDAGAWAVGMGTCLMPSPTQLQHRDAVGYRRDLEGLI